MMNLVYLKNLAAFAGVMAFGLQASQADARFAVYEVPALSSVRQMPSRPGSNARLAESIRIIATPGEFEPASFVISPSEDLEKFHVEAGDLKSKDGQIIPSENVDLRLVKCWYQAGTAWFSYFRDENRRELVPELLLKDDALIRVDYDAQHNYLRVGGEYRLVSYRRAEENEYFNYFTEPVADAKTLQPLTLKRGFHQQYWITLKIPKGAAPGIYRGDLRFSVNDQPASTLPLIVRVLPFELPPPKTYYDLDSPYLVSLYRTSALSDGIKIGVDPALAVEFQKKIYKNLFDHNVVNAVTGFSLRAGEEGEEAKKWIVEELRLMRDAGMKMNPLLTSGWAYYTGIDGNDEQRLERFRKRVAEYVGIVSREVGHHDIYLATFDEPNQAQSFILRDLAEHIHEAGKVKLWVTTMPDRHYPWLAYVTDYANQAGWGSRAEAARWHAVGAKITSYAGPHTGPENPEVFRRWEGLARYKDDFDGSFNYKYFSSLHPSLYKQHKDNVWNDFLNPLFRGFNLVYPTREGLIDTIAWEGFREGIDDVRYATKLKETARQAIAGDNIQAVYTARKALMWLETLDAKSADLHAARLEMIRYILELRNLLKDE